MRRALARRIVAIDERGAKRRGARDERRGAGDRRGAVGRHRAPAHRPHGARAGRSALRGARCARRRGGLRALHHVGHDRGGDRGDGAAAAHPRPARGDARVRGLLPDARHQARPALPRLVAVRPPADGLVPGRADRRARGRDRCLLPDRQGAGRGVQRGGPGADRDARPARRGGDGERAPVRAQPRAVDRRGAQPAGPRAARLARAEAVRRRARGAVRRDPARSRLRAPPASRSTASRSWLGRRSWSCARWSSS